MEKKNRFENNYFCFYLKIQSSIILLFPYSMSINVFLEIVIKLNACLDTYDWHLNIEKSTKAKMNFY